MLSEGAREAEKTIPKRRSRGHSTNASVGEGLGIHIGLWERFLRTADLSAKTVQIYLKSVRQLALRRPRSANRTGRGTGSSSSPGTKASSSMAPDGPERSRPKDPASWVARSAVPTRHRRGLRDALLHAGTCGDPTSAHYKNDPAGPGGPPNEPAVTSSSGTPILPEAWAS